MIYSSSKAHGACEILGIYRDRPSLTDTNALGLRNQALNGALRKADDV
jgi:hypothetical protein